MAPRRVVARGVGFAVVTVLATASVSDADQLSTPFTAVGPTAVEGSPPEITITRPGEGVRFSLNQSVTALFSCTDPDGPADIVFCTGPVANGGLVPTGAPGPADFTVTSADLAGNDVSKTNSYFVDASPPGITIAVPANGASYAKGSQIIAYYACVDDDGPQDLVSCAGPVPSGEVIDSSAVGTRSFKVDAADVAGNSATKTNTYTILGTSPPSVTIASPVDGAIYKLDAAIPLSYSCSDPDGPADIKSCTRVGGSGPLDSSIAGIFEVTVRVEDFAGNVRTTTASYEVDASAPQITITIPSDGGTYARGQALVASYACDDPDGPEDVASCIGPVGVGAVIDTTVPGTRSFRVNAEDLVGNTASKTATYAVVDASPPAVPTPPTALVPPAPVAPLPTATSCLGPGRIRLSVRNTKGARIRSLRVTVDGKKLRFEKAGRRTLTFNLAGRKRGSYAVKVRARLSDGRTITDTRMYAACATQTRRS